MGFFDKIKNTVGSEIGGVVGKTINNATKKTETIRFDDIPETLEAFAALPQAQLRTPFETAAMTIVALTVYTQDKDTGLAMLNFLKGPQPLSNYEMQFIRDRLNGRDYIPRSYFAGATPKNDYMPTAPYSITVFDNPYSYEGDSYANLYINSGGADSPRSVKSRRAKDNKWYLWEQFVLSDIRKPESTNPWA